MKKKNIENTSCLFCDSKLGLILEVETKLGKHFVCDECAKKLYKKLGSKLIPASVSNLFQNRK